MKLSKYTKWLEIKENVYALFNTILMQIIFVDKENLEKIKRLEVTKEELKLLEETGIYVKNDDIIDEVYNDLANSIKNQSKELSIMYLNISTFCNLACKYCFIESSPTSKNCYQK